MKYKETQTLEAVVFKCFEPCDRINYFIQDITHGDSLDYHCSCGRYYKKRIRIADEQVIKSVCIEYEEEFEIP